MHLEVRKKKQWYWKSVADNGQTDATSETYANKSNAVRGAKNYEARLGEFYWRIVDRMPIKVYSADGKTYEWI